jgi:hypothetical protein
MKKLTLFISCIITLVFLQACGDSKSTDPVKPDIEPKIVHEIQPDKVSEYIDNFKKDYVQINFQFEGQEFDITFEDYDSESRLAFASYELGVVVIGFDLDKEEPIAMLSVYETDESGEITKTLESAKIELTTDQDNIIYAGTVVDKSTQGVFNVRLVLNESFFGAGNSTVEVVGDKALVNGTLGTTTYIQINDLIQNNPKVTTLELQQIDGSINDGINMHTGRLIRNAQLTTLIPKNGDVNSGGVDLFAAGFKREYVIGGKVGVHSWCCENGKSAHLLSKDDPAHGAQLTYFREVLGKELGSEFYFFTINAAPADDIHIMSQDELIKYLISNK